MRRLCVALWILLGACAPSRGTGHSARNAAAERGPPYRTYLDLGRTDGLINAHFSCTLKPRATFWFKLQYGGGLESAISGYFRNVEYRIRDPLPDGLRLDASRGLILGTPTKLGMWQVRIFYADRERKHLKPGHYYVRDVEFRIFSKLEEPRR